MEYKDYYKILGVERGADADAIKAAYRKMARKYHPDVSKEANAEDRFKDLQEAYEVLKDPEKRAAYDQLGSNWRAGQDFRPPPGWGGQAGGFGAGGFGGADFGGGGFSDFFESLFRQQHGGAGGFHGGGGGGFRSQGEDSEASIQISLEDAAQGAQRDINLEMPSVGPNGQMRREARRLTVKIPKGIREGQRLRMAGQGAPGMGGGPNGDLYLQVHFQPHPKFRVEGADLYHDLHITPWEAVLGASVEVPTLEGSVRMKIPAGSSSGQKLRLAQKGLPGTGNKPAGDLYAIIQIVVPKHIGDDEKALWTQLGEISNFHPRR
ncbi:DnaJ C-terminal domain-containing protein [Acidithiobacillus montserratensis]|uniref:DnaJ C-terminal domain-containing protein n=1 Tax=Acidithiobacillus montserratensis TaxID=2729135 RepID=A0ACD5HFA2_9PROT|nr:DnaJ C-terminal domain-containing protein [Acidithiobacillus montserratensis]MBN2680354.1 DnaJ domain-containing protein [Acidithiobacillaceae bacterium]MBU2748713.1 DnaJ domain-containing protein [Acidithiobacillus montserratensis]